jgi:hypothetical protein
MCKAEQLIGRLTPAERRSLRLMGQASARPRVPVRHAERLIGLGLAELVCGAPDLTAAGRRAVALIGAWVH